MEKILQRKRKGTQPRIDIKAGRTGVRRLTYAEKGQLGQWMRARLEQTTPIAAERSERRFGIGNNDEYSCSQKVTLTTCECDLSQDS